jgi:hypothetical protein
MSKDSEAKTRVMHRHAAAAGGAPAEVGGQIVFHCPNGHRIMVTRSLAGKRGKCSKCGASVEIPREEAATEGEAPAASEPAGLPVETTALPVAMLPPEGMASAATWPATESWDFIDDRAGENSWPGEPVAGPATDSGHPTASLVARLWAERAHGGVIELHLANGSVILPEWYDAEWSRGSHGLFASQAADGTVTLTAVAWETVQKVIVRKLTAVPDDMFH